MEKPSTPRRNDVHRFPTCGTRGLRSRQWRRERQAESFVARIAPAAVALAQFGRFALQQIAVGEPLGKERRPAPARVQTALGPRQRRRVARAASLAMVHAAVETKGQINPVSFGIEATSTQSRKGTCRDPITI